MGKSIKWRKILFIFLFFLIVCNGLVTIFAEKASLENDGKPLDSIHVQGVIDRMEDGDMAVILVEELGLEFVVAKEDFDMELVPSIWVDLVLVAKEVKEISINWERTKKEEKKVKELMEELIKENH